MDKVVNISVLVYIAGILTGIDALKLFALVFFLCAAAYLRIRGRNDPKPEPVSTAELFRYLLFLDQPRWLMLLMNLLTVLFVTTAIMHLYMQSQVPGLFVGFWILFAVYLLLNIWINRRRKANMSKPALESTITPEG